jgi:hypothetical protein
MSHGADESEPAYTHAHTHTHTHTSTYAIDGPQPRPITACNSYLAPRALSCSSPSHTRPLVATPQHQDHLPPPACVSPRHAREAGFHTVRADAGQHNKCTSPLAAKHALPQRPCLGQTTPTSPTCSETRAHHTHSSNDRQPSIRVPSVRNFNDTLAQESVRYVHLAICTPYTHKRLPLHS